MDNGILSSVVRSLECAKYNYMILMDKKFSHEADAPEWCEGIAPHAALQNACKLPEKKENPAAVVLPGTRIFRSGTVRAALRPPVSGATG
ncbi:MAG TPA: hypothetical protein VF859_00590 [Burkholderiales bacterium]